MNCLRLPCLQALLFVALTPLKSQTPSAAGPEVPAYRFEHKKSTVFAVNPVHLPFGHATVYLDFFSARKSRASTRLGASLGISEARRRYLWALSLDRKYYVHKHYKPSSFYFGPGVVGGLIYKKTRDNKGVWAIAPQILTGFQLQRPKTLNLSLEAGVGLPLVFGGFYEPENPFVFTLGLMIGFRGMGKD